MYAECVSESVCGSLCSVSVSLSVSLCSECVLEHVLVSVEHGKWTLCHQVPRFMARETVCVSVVYV